MKCAWMSMTMFFMCCHSRASGNPVSSVESRWVPAWPFLETRLRSFSRGRRAFREPLLRSADRFPYRQVRHREDIDRDAERIERVVDRVRDRGGRTEVAGFARAFLTERGERGGRAVIDDRHRRHFHRARDQVIHKGAARQLPILGVGELLVERRADAVGDAAVGHAVDDVRIDHHAAVVAADVFADRGLRRVRVDLDEHDVRLERVAGIDLYTTLWSRESPARRHFPDELRLKARLHAGGKLVELAVRDLDQLVPGEFLRGRAFYPDAAVAVFEVLGRALEIVSGDGD